MNLRLQCPLAECPLDEIRSSWLHPLEQEALSRRRRSEGSLGARWLAKRAILGWLEERGESCDAREIAILGGDEPPRVHLPERLGVCVSLSLSHSNSRVACLLWIESAPAPCRLSEARPSLLP